MIRSLRNIDDDSMIIHTRSIFSAKQYSCSKSFRCSSLTQLRSSVIYTSFQGCSSVKKPLGSEESFSLSYISWRLMENGLITMITGSRVDAHEHKNTHKKKVMVKAILQYIHKKNLICRHKWSGTHLNIPSDCSCFVVFIRECRFLLCFLNAYP
jgi:hypothetical protein